MLYHLKQGKAEETIVEQCRRMRRPLPQHIQDAPELLMGLELFYTAFVELSSCRSLGMSVGPIPWTAMKDYAMAHDLDPEQVEDLFYHSPRMDSTYLSHIENKMKDRSKKPVGKKRR